MIKHRFFALVSVTTLLIASNAMALQPKSGVVTELEQLVKGGSADTTLNEILANNRYVVIDFHALWCGPCKNFAPHFSALAQEFPDVVFLKVNVDSSRALAQRYGVSSMPTFLLFNNERLAGRFTGANKGELRKLITSKLTQ